MINKLKCASAIVSLTLSLSACSVNAAQPSVTPSQDSLIDAQARAALPKSVRLSGHLEVGIDTTYAPNEFKDSSGNPAGWEVELMKAIGQRLGVFPRYHQVSFESIIPAVKSSAFDVGLSSFFDTPDRQKLVDLVDYYSAGILWVQKAGEPRVNPSAACGLSVGVQLGTYESDVDLPHRSAVCLSLGQKSIDIVEYKNQSDANDAVLLGRVKAFVADSPVSLYAVKESFGSLKAVGAIYSPLNYGMAVKKGSRLGKALVVAIQSIQADGTYQKILNSWGVSDGALTRPLINGVEK